MFMRIEYNLSGHMALAKWFITQLSSSSAAEEQLRGNFLSSLKECNMKIVVSNIYV